MMSLMDLEKCTIEELLKRGTRANGNKEKDMDMECFFTETNKFTLEIFRITLSTDRENSLIIRANSILKFGKRVRSVLA